MKKRLLVCLIVTMLVTGIIGSAAAFENVTAQEAYDMVNSGQAILIDVRTLEECYWVGMPAVTPGGLYVIPWQTITISPDGTVTTRTNLDFESLILQSFPEKSQPLIIICRSGARSTSAAKALENLGYMNIYEIDNALKEATSSSGGRGGVQGTSYGGAYNGYRGYPGRLPINTSSGQTVVVTATDLIGSPEDSTSWMDTGLPITQDLNNAVIPVLINSLPTAGPIYPKGWSMMSLHVNPADKRLNKLFPDAVVVYGYEKGTGYVRVKPDEDLEVERGYWILLDKEKSYTLTGDSIPSHTYPVYEDGWLMIGGCSSSAQVSPNNCNIGVIYRYVQEVGYQRVTGHLEPGQGYWILLTNVTGGAMISVETKEQ